MRSLFFITTLLSLSTALIADDPQPQPPPAAFTLDSVMDRTLQQKSGIAYLTRQQKSMIENWLNDTFILKPKQNSTNSAEYSLYLSINVDNGKQLRLSDNSLWDVAPADQQTAAFWITPFPLKLSASNDPNYPMLMTNLNTNVQIRVKRAATS
jgi:hypothetical protein